MVTAPSHLNNGARADRSTQLSSTRRQSWAVVDPQSSLILQRIDLRQLQLPIAVMHSTGTRLQMKESLIPVSIQQSLKMEMLIFCESGFSYFNYASFSLVQKYKLFKLPSLAHNKTKIKSIKLLSLIHI